MDARMKFALLVNRNARRRTAGKRWAFLRNQVLSFLPPETVEVPFDPPYDLDKCLAGLFLDQDVTGLISVGGDGTMHNILNAMLRHPEWRPEDRLLGGIGLGSSNDFIKPVKETLWQAPVRLDWRKPFRSDVGKVSFVDPEGGHSVRYFLLNASAGVTAQANHLFNREDATLRRLKPFWTQCAILYAVLKTLFSFRNIPVKLQWDDQTRTLDLSNLAILKVPYVSGNFRYDQDIRPDDGWLGLNYCYNMNRLELIRTLFDLGKGRFVNRPKRVSAKVKELLIDFPCPAPFETDGEVTPVIRLEVSLLPNAVQLMGIGLPSPNQQL